MWGALAGDFLVNLLVAFVSFGVGLIGRRLILRITHRRERRFWRPLVRGGRVKVVFATFVSADERALEASGLCGVGDVRVLLLLQQYFEDLRMARIEPQFSHITSQADLRGNLVTVGGSDVNEVTRGVLRALGMPEDAGLGDLEISADQRDITDFGTVIRAHNPAWPEASVVVLAGTRGYGTWAACELLRRRQFLDHELVASGEDIRVTFAVDVVREGPFNIRDLRVEPLTGLSPAPAPAAAPAPSPP